MSPPSLPASRAPSPSHSGNPAKRKKLSTSCDACQKRKSRCEMVTANGCHRCRTLNTKCSRAGKASGNGGSGEVFDDFGTEAEGSEGGPADRGSALAEIQGRTRRIEAMLGGLLAQSGGFGRPGPSLTEDLPEVSSTGQSTHHAASATANRALILNRGNNLADPVSAGIITAALWEAVYSRQHIIPLSSLLHTLQPYEPFLRTCILVYQANGRSMAQPGYDHLFRLLRDSLDRLPVVRPTRQIVLGLFILSLTPSLPHSGRTYVSPDHFGAASRAMDMARVVGLEQAEERVLREAPEDWERDWLKRDIEGMKLWYAIIHRVRWVELLNSPFLHSSPVTPIPTQAYALQDPMFAYLFLENDLLGLFELVSVPFRLMCTSRIYDPSHALDLIQAVNTYTERAVTWEGRVMNNPLLGSSKHHLIVTHHLINIIFYLRLSDWHNLSSPLGPDTTTQFTRLFASRILTSSVSAINSLLDHLAASPSSSPSPLLRVLPAFTFMLVLLAYKAVVQSRKLKEATPPPGGTGQDSTDGEIIDPGRLSRIRSALIQAHRQYVPLVAMIDGEAPPREWGEGLRDLQAQHEFGGSDWQEWERLFDFDLYSGSLVGWGMAFDGDDMGLRLAESEVGDI